jgi:hypothetical protein
MIALLLLVAAHSASEGKSAFDVHEDGAVSIDVRMGALDLPELCNVDLSVTSRRAEQEARLDACVQKGFPLWLRVSADGHACPLTPEGWRELEPVTVPPVLALSARAQCKAPIGRLTLDWGFFRGTPLDHTSVARVRIQGHEDRMFLFSKRASKLELEVERTWPWRTLALAGGAALALAVVVVLVLSARSRRRG